AGSRTNIFKEETTDLKPSNVAVRPYKYDVSPEYFHAAGTALLAGRDLGWHDDKSATSVAVVKRQFAIRMFGYFADALDRYYMVQDGTSVQVVGDVEDGKYMSLTEDPEPAIFPAFLQSPTSSSNLVVRSSRDPQQLAAATRNKLHELDSGLPVEIPTWTR